MPKQIYNEGRVVGLSSYEMYVREYLSQGHSQPPASEREWLSSTLAFGASMLLRVPTVTPSAGVEDVAITIPFPADSRLCAANTIIASFFHGDARPGSNISVIPEPTRTHVGMANWATQVTDYGELIANNNSSYPILPDPSSAPLRSSLAWTAAETAQLEQYLKIVDGVVLQPGNWTAANPTPPKMDLEFDPSGIPAVRLHIKGSIDTPFWILLTGFTDRIVVLGEAGVDGSTGTDSPSDGDFLGPAAYPWANKIIFSIPQAAASMVGGSSVTITKSPATNSTHITIESDGDQATLLSMANESGVDYNTSGSSGTVNLEMTGSPTGPQGKDTKYSVDLNWDTLLAMLTTNKRGNINFTIRAEDPNTSEVFELGNALTSLLGSKLVYWRFQYYNLNIVFRLKPWAGETNYSTIASDNSVDGFLRVALRLFESDFSPVSKFELCLIPYLKQDYIHETYSQSSLGGAAILISNGVAYRGSVVDIGPQNHVKLTAGQPSYSSYNNAPICEDDSNYFALNPNLSAIFATSQSASSDPRIAGNGNLSGAIMYLWNTVPEGAAYKPLRDIGRMTATTIGSGYMNVNTTIQANSVLGGSSTQGNDEIRLIDCSGSYGTPPDYLCPMYAAQMSTTGTSLSYSEAAAPSTDYPNQVKLSLKFHQSLLPTQPSDMSTGLVGAVVLKGTYVRN